MNSVADARFDGGKNPGFTGACLTIEFVQQHPAERDRSAPSAREVSLVVAIADELSSPLEKSPRVCERISSRDEEEVRSQLPGELSSCEARPDSDEVPA